MRRTLPYIASYAERPWHHRRFHHRHVCKAFINNDLESLAQEGSRHNRIVFIRQEKDWQRQPASSPQQARSKDLRRERTYCTKCLAPLVSSSARTVCMAFMNNHCRHKEEGLCFINSYCTSSTSQRAATISPQQARRKPP